MADTNGSLNFVESAFLKGLKAYENYGPRDTAVKLYNDAVQRNRTDPITEKDFSDEELESMQRLVLAHAKNSGKNQGHIDYPDYLKYKSDFDSNILGGFDYSIDADGRVIVTDTYDFNANRGAPGDSNEILQGIAAVANPRGLAAEIGRKKIPDTGGHGIPVKISLESSKTEDGIDPTVLTNNPILKQQKAIGEPLVEGTRPTCRHLGSFGGFV